MMKEEKRQKSVFICGPIIHMFRNGNFDTRMKHMLERVISVFNAKGWIVFSAHKAERFEHNINIAPEEIRVRDFGWIDAADLVVFFFPTGADGLAVRTDGSFMELGYAISSKKEIVIFTEKEKLILQSLLFRGAESIAKVNDFADLPAFLNRIESGEAE